MCEKKGGCRRVVSLSLFLSKMNLTPLPPPTCSQHHSPGIAVDVIQGVDEGHDCGHELQLRLCAALLVRWTCELSDP
jgi:hypothetical protein